MTKIVKHKDGNWSINGYLLGVDTDFINHMVNDNNWTPTDIVEYAMHNVVAAMKAVVLDETSTTTDTCQYGTEFEYEGVGFDVLLAANGTIEHVRVPNVSAKILPVALINRFSHQVELEQQRARGSRLWSDNTEEPSTRVYLATSPTWKGARLITDLPGLMATVNDPTVTSFVRLEMELSMF